MFLQKVLSLASLALFSSAQNTSIPAIPEPEAPGLTFLYTAFAECENSLYESQGPRGIRKAIPIIGGNFTGPRLRGEILNLGADWGLTDPQTGIFSADTRYNFRTHDGANILLQTSGPAQPEGGLQLRVLFETGDKDYYWLNNVVAVGKLSSVEDKSARKEGESFLLRIDVWHLTTENDQTKFINGSVYGRDMI